MVCFIGKHIINFYLAYRKWCTFFKCNICVIVCSYGYISWNWNQFIRIIIKTWCNTFRFEFDRIVLVVFIFCCLTVYSIPFFVASLDSSLLELLNKFIIFCISTLYFMWKFKSCFFWFFNDKVHCCFIIFFKFTNKINSSF